MTDRDRVSEEELTHDIEQMRQSELFEEFERTAESIINDLDEMNPVLDGIEMAEDDEKISLLKAIRTRDHIQIGILVLMMLKAEIVAALGDN